jgi:tRNA(Arg) A34 adenosine deaminase TadA
MSNYIDQMLAISVRVALMGDTDRKYCLGAVAKRTDGALVYAYNGRPLNVHAPSHAEFRLSKKLDSSSTVFVSRVNRNTGVIALSKPCNACQIALKSRNVNKVIYSITDKEYGVMFL